MKIAFLGTPDFVLPIQKTLAQHFTLTDSLKEADLAVVAAYGKILNKEELSAPRYGAINVHPSLLPRYRGPSPIQAAILNGDSVSGITIIKLDAEVDHGPIIYQGSLELSSSDNFDTLSKKMFLRASEVLPKIIEDFVNNKIKPVPQNHSEASFCPLLTRESGYFDISNPSPPTQIDRMIRAYYPWPGVWCKWKMDNGQLKIIKFLPGGLLQMEGGKPTPWKVFLNNYPNFPVIQTETGATISAT